VSNIGTAMDTDRDAQQTRPDAMDLIGPQFDRPASEPAKRTLIICSAPRTGSYELCRYLLAAGIGVPHEYFHGNYAQLLAQRWAFTEHPLVEAQLGRYIGALRRRRAQNGVFATKLQFGQFDRFLRNRHGAALFDGATVVHLFRPDVATQYASARAALESGTWDFSQRQTSPPVVHDRSNFNEYFKQALDELNWIIGEDTGFRGLFVLLNIRPIFVTTDELFGEPRSVVGRIAAAMAVSIDEAALSSAIALSAAYGHDRAREKAVAGLAESFKKIAFQRQG
jgi:LPS sulfotransferase NodH